MFVENELCKLNFIVLSTLIFLVLFLFITCSCGDSLYLIQMPLYFVADLPPISLKIRVVKTI